MFSKIKKHFSSIEEEKLETLIKEFGGEDLSSLLFFLPKKYEFFLSTKNIKNEENKDILIKLQIKSIDGIINKGAYNTRIGKKPITISCLAESEFEVELVFFQISNVLLQKLKVNSIIICQGKLTINKTKVQIIHPKISHNLNNHQEDCIVQTINQFEMVQNIGTINKSRILKINPIYHYIDGFYQYQIQNIIKKAIQIIQTEHQNELEKIDDATRYINSFSQSCIENNHKNHNFLDLIKIIHNTSVENLKHYHSAMEELSFTEIITGQIALRFARLGIKDKEGIAIANISNDNSMIKHVLNNMHFKLTEDQENALNEIQNDQKSSKQMVRLLHGDVGSGKTIVAILAALGVVENGYQAFFLAPTAILAKQHHNTIQKVCFGLGLNVRCSRSRSRL